MSDRELPLYFGINLLNPLLVFSYPFFEPFVATGSLSLGPFPPRHQFREARRLFLSPATAAQQGFSLRLLPPLAELPVRSRSCPLRLVQPGDWPHPLGASSMAKRRRRGRKAKTNAARGICQTMWPTILSVSWNRKAHRMGGRNMPIRLTAHQPRHTRGETSSPNRR